MDISMNGYSSKKILVVDDEEEIRSLVKETLKVDDFSVVEAEDGEGALNLVNHEDPDLVLLDIRMPGQYDGLEVCRRIKQDTNTQKIPVIFLTAVPIPELTYQETKAECVFSKPFSPIKLVDKVCNVLRGV